jgi:cytochrome c oxidase subunit IV
MKQTRGWAEICSVIWLIFMVWALVLAMKIHTGPKRIEHLVFALLFPPIYVLAYYISCFGSETGVSKTVNVGFM